MAVRADVGIEVHDRSLSGPAVGSTLPGMADQVTGEAVLLDIPPASFASRAVSGAIDLAIELLGLFLVFIVLGLASVQLDAAATAALAVVLAVGIFVGVPAVVETLTRGRTLGKLAMGLRAVRDDGGPIRWRHALTRALVGVVELWFLVGVPALLTSMATARGKRLGDLVAGTYVVRERSARQHSVMAQMPQHLARWAEVADIGRLPDDLALSVRQFISRAGGMQPAARGALGLQLAQSLKPYVAPPPPSGTSPEAFLSAVLAERRRRDVIRLAREHHARQRLAGVDSVEAALAAVRRP